MRGRITQLDPCYMAGKSLREGRTDFIVVLILCRIFFYVRSQSFDYGINLVLRETILDK
jgi:hypothetical protein